MKLKNIFFSRWFCLVVLMVCFGFLVFVCFFQKEKYQQQKKNIVDVIDDFCNQHFGEEWGIDNIQHYNEKIVFVVVQSKGVIVDLSIQPEIKTIIVEKTKGKTNLKKRVYRY